MKGKRGSKWYSILYTHVAVKGEVYVMPSFIGLNEYPTEDPYGTQLYSINQLVSGDTKR